MASILVQISKYIIMFLLLIYIFGALYVFRYKNAPEDQKTIYVIQKILMYLIHGIGFVCLYLNGPNIELIGFYIMQVLLITVIFLCFHFLYKKTNILLLNNMCMLLIIGFVMLTRISFEQAFRQFVFVTFGIVLMCIIPLFLKKGSVFRNFSVLYFVVGTVLLGVVTIIGTTDYGAKLNLSIGSISFQPSEFVKIIFVFFVASMLYKNASFKRILLTSCLSAVYVLLLVASRDLGGALLYFMAYLVIVYVASKKARYLFAGLLGMSIAAIAGYFLFSHVRIRVFAWLDPLADIDNRGYQICQSLFGIGTGGWFGLGIGKGLPGKIPVVEKDFIFSAISEEFGGIFAMALILLCLSCFLMMVHSAVKLKDKFYKLVAIGLATIYAMQVTLTIGGAIKFIPSTGVTLPLVSYGGSSMLSTLIVFGIIQGLYMRKSYSANKNKTVTNNSEYAHIAYFFLAIFLSMILYLAYFIGFKSEEFINNEYNGLWTVFEEDVTKGKIFTSDGYVIAETVTEDGEEVRNYPHKNLFAHVGGYSQKGRTGLEHQLNFRLLRSNAPFYEQIMCELTNEKVPGDNAVTTLRYDLQKIAYDALENYEGAVVVLEPSTGKILAMVSKPDYDPNTILSEWESIQEGTALYNRATQGLYAPGSVFKIFTSLAYIRSNPDSYGEYSYECLGEIATEGHTIHCASGKSHGTLDLEMAFAKSCNCAYASMVEDIDQEIWKNACDSMLFGQNLPIAYESLNSSFVLNETDTSALQMITAIGQGKTLVSPLHMAMIAGGICNDGVVMRPRLIEHIENYQGLMIDEISSEEYKTIITKEEVVLMEKYMRTAVTDGTAAKLNVDTYTAYGKTGTAQTSSDLDVTNAWFVGYASKEEYEDIAIAVIIEDSGEGSEYAVPVAKKIFDAYFQ